MSRTEPQVVVTRYSPNMDESRIGGVSAIKLIVLHSTEGSNIPHSVADLEGVAGWFAERQSQVSSHVITDSDGHSARCVHDKAKAWHCYLLNSASLGIEQIGHAADTDWAQRTDQLDETARWIAHWHHKWGIPIQRGRTDGTQILKPGVVTHAQLGGAGGGHTDPGTHYPVDDVIRRALHFA